MANFLGKLIGIIINIIMIPIFLIFAIPMGILKARRAQKSRLLFTGSEQALLGKAQRTIDMDENGLFSPDRDLLEVARCIENARCDYQIIKSRERFDSTFFEFVVPRIYNCDVVDWDNIISFFELSSHPMFEEADRSIDEDVDDDVMSYNGVYDEIEEQTGKSDIVDIITQGVNSRIGSERVALQFVLEELDAARQGNEEAIQFVKNSGFSASEYEGAMQNSFEEVDGPNGPQQYLFSAVMQYSSNPDFMVNLRLQVVKNVMNIWELDVPQKENLNEESIEKQNEIISQLVSLSESNEVKTCRMSISPIYEEWSWDFEFSDEELETANELVSILYDLRNGDFIAPVYNIVKRKDSSPEFGEDIPF